MSLLSSNDLGEFNFKDINPDYPYITVNQPNVPFFVLLKFRTEIIRNFQVQLLMITLGFVRACPGHILAKSTDLNLVEALGGRTILTAQEMISAFHVDGPLLAVLPYCCFSNWIRTLSSDQLMKLFRFVTGMRVFNGNLSKLNLKIVFLSPGTEHLLPHANTCQKTLILPAYATEEQAMTRFNDLLIYLESGDAFGFGFV